MNSSSKQHHSITASQHHSNMASSKKAKHETDEAQSEDALGATSDEDDEPMDLAMDDTAEDRRASLNRRDSMIVAAEDSQESTVIKTLSELVSLVVSSLDNKSHHETEGDDEQQRSSLTLETDDILSEKFKIEKYEQILCRLIFRE